jgi:hypothetical protein
VLGVVRIAPDVDDVPVQDDDFSCAKLLCADSGVQSEAVGLF